MSEGFNPYGGQENNLPAETQPLDQVLQIAVDAVLKDLHTMIPAKIIKIRDDGFVDIRPSIKRLYINATEAVNLPQVLHCPVGYLRGADYYIKPPYAVGDLGYALFCERSLDKWSVAAGEVDPQDSRTHDLTDAVFIPGLYPANAVLKVDADVLLLKNGSAEVHLKKAGTFLFKNTKIPDELLQILDDLTGILAGLTATAGVNPVIFVPPLAAAIGAIQSRIEALKG